MSTTSKKLIAAGNSLALVLDKPVLEATGITRETALEISTDGDVIVISPVRDAARKQRVSAIVDGLFTRHAGLLRRLAQ
jgi:antitoxin MazE